MKRVLSIAAASLMLLALLAGCAGNANNAGSGTADTGSTAEKLKVGMVTDSGTIDDKSFNQGTWEGVLMAKSQLGVDEKYLKPNGEATSDYTQEIKNLYDSGYKVIVCPGFKFELAVYESQTKYADAKFVILDGEPNDGDWSAGAPVYKTESNVLCYLFAEDQAGFLAGIAAALHVQTGDLGFIGGMAVPAVQRFNWGFQQGVAYANANLGTSCEIKAENCVYSDSFTDLALGQQLAATMYDRGVKVIFAAAGGVGIGVINEGKQRRASGQDVWVVGVDVDQYNDGIYEGEKSCILTSAMKKLDVATFDAIKAVSEGTFKGGQTLTLDASNDGVGLPKTNPNLSADITKAVDEAFAKIKSGELKVQNTQGNLLP